MSEQQPTGIPPHEEAADSVDEVAEQLEQAVDDHEHVRVDLEAHREVILELRQEFEERDKASGTAEQHEKYARIMAILGGIATTIGVIAAPAVAVPAVAVGGFGATGAITGAWAWLRKKTQHAIELQNEAVYAVRSSRSILAANEYDQANEDEKTDIVHELTHTTDEAGEERDKPYAEYIKEDYRRLYDIEKDMKRLQSEIEATEQGQVESGSIEQLQEQLATNTSAQEMLHERSLDVTKKYLEGGKIEKQEEGDDIDAVLDQALDARRDEIIASRRRRRLSEERRGGLYTPIHPAATGGGGGAF